ncbi:MAG: hypothetical protein JNL82_19275, partial [Myxococcales bacterium]|nr:hypothetical protein [Myxococcales bacterium]
MVTLGALPRLCQTRVNSGKSRDTSSLLEARISGDRGPSGKQDLIVHILAKGDRYELANYRNAAIPTNIEVADSTRHDFPAFYA